MNEIVVIHSERDGMWHLCQHQPGTCTFLSFQSFVSRALAEAMAWKMSRDRNNGVA